MTWTETHKRYRIIREVVAAAEKSGTGVLPWRDEYATVFGSPENLVDTLRLRWQRTCQAQLDFASSEEEMKTRHRELLNANAAVLKILDHHKTMARNDEAVSGVA